MHKHANEKNAQTRVCKLFVALANMLGSIKCKHVNV